MSEMESFLRLKFVAILCLISINIPAMARTWTVEKDGTGDFTSLQPAANTAASGDTIRIGPGRFDEVIEVDCPNGLLFSLMAPQQDELTIIGFAGSQTIIGPEVMYGPDPENYSGINSWDQCGSNVLYVRDIVFENLGIGVVAQGGTVVDISGCSILGCIYGLISDRQTISMAHTDFLGASLGPATFATAPMGGDIRSFILDNCISDCRLSWSASSHVGIPASEFYLINNCQFIGGGIGLSLASIGPAVLTITNSLFSQIGGSGINIHWLGSQPGMQVSVSDCHFSDMRCGINDGTAGDVFIRGEGLVFSDVEKSSIRYWGRTQGQFRNCVLAKGEDGVVAPHPNSLAADGDSSNGDPLLNSALFPPFPSHDQIPNFQGFSAGLKPLILDMTNNWWGTTNPDSIQAWIIDGNDDPYYPIEVLWDPFLEQNVNTQRVTSGGFRAMFR